MKATLGVLIVLAVLTMAPAWAGSPLMLRVDGQLAQMQGLRMSLDGEFVGLVGDSIALSQASHTLTIDLPWGMQATYALAVKGTEITATLSSGYLCIGKTSWWISGRQSSVVQGGPLQVLILSKLSPTFDGVCALELPNLNCQRANAGVHIGAVPEVGAEIWVDGMPLEATTSSVFSVSFCSGTSPYIDVLLRKEGYASCSARVEFGQSADNTYQVSCELRKL